MEWNARRRAGPETRRRPGGLPHINSLLHINSLAILAGFLVVSVVGLGAASPEVADALARGDNAAAKKLIEQKADVNIAQADGATELRGSADRA